ncbi:MAG: efflux RND transporter periplasmic adaptor subunit [Deltaproteobacteria bacterium]|nr:efflux RND transporter periplasmic adaptor subunit [Deltaproteobacteria bacterium]
MRRFLCAGLVVPLALATGCGRSSSENVEVASAKAEAAPQPEGTTAPNPGAEGLCKEHGVLESICTKCNPALAPVFRARGDWCEEHGFPESVCPLCHPERGGRPSVDVAGDEAPADGLRVRLRSADTVRLAGIETVRAVAGRSVSELIAPVSIAYDATRLAHVNARAAGVVKKLHADVGSAVRAGSALAVVESAAVGVDQSRLAAAKSRVQLAESKYRRESELHQKGISARVEVEAAEQELAEAKAEYAALSASLGVVGGQKGSTGQYTLTAPLSGVVTQRNVSLNQYVDTQTALFEIVDTSVMWAEIAVPESDLGSVRSGSRVVITVDGLGSREFRGSISYIEPVVDPQTRTAKARVRLANPSGLLRANMFGKARISAAGSRSSAAVPRTAVQRAKSAHLAFVRVAPDAFETRRVQLVPGQWEGSTVELASGIEPGEEVVTTGSFFLKTETLKDAIGAGCCDVEQK